jgi:signal transduction histidine kinase
VAAEVLYYASLEAVRNAARHASGGDPARALSLRITARWRDGLDLLVEDDGVGLLHGPAQPGERQGLLIHTTMMAVVGGSLTLAPGDHGQGTAVRLWLPAASLSEDAIGDA